jgi:hypothetical protein
MVHRPVRTTLLAPLMSAALVVAATVAFGASVAAATPENAPEVVFTSAPSGETTDTGAVLAWTTDARRSRCSLDDAPAALCTSPTTLTGLTLGAHTFRVIVSRYRYSTSATASWSVAAEATLRPPPIVPPPPDEAPPPPGVPPAAGVAAPTPPSSYSVPAGAVRVTTASALTVALAAQSPVIVLADGTYDQAAPFLDSGASSLYAEHLGRAVLRTGLVLGGNSGTGGAIIRGLVFDVADPARVLGGGIVHVWGPAGRNSQVLDTVMRGGWAVPVGLLAYNPSGLRVERSEFRSFTDVGVRLSDNVGVAYGAATPTIGVVQDILIDGVSRPVPGASNGTAEAGLWVGHPVAGGVHRIKVRNVSWSGIQTVNNARDTSYTDLDVDMSGARQSHGVGVYLEHFSHKLDFERFSLTGVKVGFNGEWADPAWGGSAAMHNVAIRNGVIDSSGSTLAGNQAGIYLDEGSESTTVSGVTFRNQNWAGIGAFRNIGTNAFSLNTFSLRPGAVTISPNHI